MTLYKEPELHNLFIATRSVLELADPISDDESVINTDNLDDLQSAYQAVVYVYGPSHKGFEL